jgi:hypothetical protein
VICGSIVELNINQDMYIYIYIRLYVYVISRHLYVYRYQTERHFLSKFNSVQLVEFLEIN